MNAERFFSCFVNSIATCVPTGNIIRGLFNESSEIYPRFLVMGENIKNGRRYLTLGQNLISSPIFNILPHYEKPRVKLKNHLS
jgi:hypothetical protein